MPAAIRVESVSKRYELRHAVDGRPGGGPRTFRDAIVDGVKSLARRPAHGRRTESREDFWALKKVSFEIQPGEAVAVIGRNGAGKSTLLKLLSRITEPTSGRITIRGRVASLLEVGTGFHPELSGRENIFLNGAILGMSRTEIRRKFDEIVDFAEVERFIDTPVKRYSSGMYVRLAFAVAAHLEPETLVVDEVLAVGDARFQRKCLQKMGDVAGIGRTVLFVSHNMAAVRTFCSRTLLLSGGELLLDGRTPEVIDRYLQDAQDTPSDRSWPHPAEAPGNEDIRLESVRAVPPEGELAITIDTGAALEVAFFNRRAGINLDCTVHLTTADGTVLFESGHLISHDNDSRTGRYRVRCALPAHLLNTGRYGVNLIFGKDQQHILYKCEEIVMFEVENTATGRGRNLNVAPGIIRPLLAWQCQFQGQD